MNSKIKPHTYCREAGKKKKKVPQFTSVLAVSNTQSGSFLTFVFIFSFL